VIAMLAIGDGASYEAQEQLKSLGSQNIILRSVKPPEDQKISESGSRQNYTLAYGLKEVDVRRIRATIPGIRRWSPVSSAISWNVRYRVDASSSGPFLVPGDAESPGVKGRFFTEREADDKENVCVIGEEMVAKLFPFEQALGGSVRVGRSYFRSSASWPPGACRPLPAPTTPPRAASTGCSSPRDRAHPLRRDLFRRRSATWNRARRTA
jgi:putative ABC transport system permease protein